MTWGSHGWMIWGSHGWMTWGSHGVKTCGTHGCEITLAEEEAADDTDAEADADEVDDIGATGQGELLNVTEPDDEELELTLAEELKLEELDEEALADAN